MFAKFRVLWIRPSGLVLTRTTATDRYPMHAGNYERWMAIAIDQCERAIAHQQSPFGAAIVSPDGHLVAAEHNVVAARNDPTAHAEVMAIRAACQALEVAKLRDHWLVSTGEPCLMCASVAVLSGVGAVVYGADNQFIESLGFKTGGVPCEEVFRQSAADIVVHRGVAQARCEQLLRQGSRR
ncbi:nucleoside deaminase [Roseimaritima sediminicola]|uniref:nucleoside deaminase n=1 Tax=Roseimaritima sediminicola TaxID=2662066 RepID=UPI0012983D84|nr:nucleoside deaminase [Roseimaritima sediminicola]